MKIVVTKGRELPPLPRTTPHCVVWNCDAIREKAVQRATLKGNLTFESDE